MSYSLARFAASEVVCAPRYVPNKSLNLIIFWRSVTFGAQSQILPISRFRSSLRASYTGNALRVKFQPIDLSGEAKQTASTIHTSADLFSQLFPVSGLLYELTYSGNALRVIENL